MNILPALLLNLVVVAGGIVIYDQLREDAPAPVVSPDGGVDGVDESRIVAKILEEFRSNEPMLETAGTDPRVLARLAALEQGRAVERPAPGAGAPVATDPAAGAPLAAPEPLVDGDEPGDAEVARFRRLMERAEQLRRDEREQQRVMDMLERLEIKLTPAQQTKLMGSMRSFRKKMGETMQKAFRDGGGREGAREAMEGLREEFTVELQEYLSVGDVQKITEGAAGMLRGFGRGPGRGR